MHIKVLYQTCSNAALCCTFVFVYIADSFFTEGIYQVPFFVGVRTEQVPIQVFPERLRSGMNGRFNVTIVSADDDGVIIVSPSEAEVIVPFPF